MKKIYIFLILALLVIPAINMFSDNVKSDGNIENDANFIYYDIPENSFGNVNNTFFNYTKFWNKFNNIIHIGLQYRNSSIWIWKNETLQVIKNYSDNFDSVKISFLFTSPFDADYRFIFAVDKKAKNYIFKQDKYTYYLNYSFNNNNSYSVFFNFTDIANINGVNINHGINNNYMYAIFRKDNVQKNKTILLDPTFGTTATGSYAWNMYNMVYYLKGSPANNGYAESISAYIRLNTADHTELISYALYNMDTLEFISNTTEGLVRDENWHWKTLNFPENKKPYLYNDITYGICVQSPCETSNNRKILLNYRVASSDFSYQYPNYYYNRWNKTLSWGELYNYTTLNLSIYCTYSETDNYPPDVMNYYPLNNSNVNIPLILTVNAFDNEGDDIIVTWYSNSTTTSTWENSSIEFKPRDDGLKQEYSGSSPHYLNVNDNNDATYVYSVYGDIAYCSNSDYVYLYQHDGSDLTTFYVSLSTLWKTYFFIVNNNHYGNNFTYYDILNLQGGSYFLTSATPKRCLNSLDKEELFEIEDNSDKWNSQTDLVFNFINLSVRMRDRQNSVIPPSQERQELSEVSIIVNYTWYKPAEFLPFGQDSGDKTLFTTTNSNFTELNHTYYYYYTIQDEYGNITTSDIISFTLSEGNISENITISNIFPNVTINFYFCNDTFNFTLTVNSSIGNYINISVYFEGVFLFYNNGTNRTIDFDIYSYINQTLYYENNYSWNVTARNNNTIREGVYMFNTGNVVYCASLTFDSNQYFLIIMLAIWWFFIIIAEWNKINREYMTTTALYIFQLVIGLPLGIYMLWISNGIFHWFFGFIVIIASIYYLSIGVYVSMRTKK